MRWIGPKCPKSSRRSCSVASSERLVTRTVAVSSTVRRHTWLTPLALVTTRESHPTTELTWRHSLHRHSIRLTLHVQTQSTRAFILLPPPHTQVYPHSTEGDQSTQHTLHRPRLKGSLIHLVTSSFFHYFVGFQGTPWESWQVPLVSITTFQCVQCGQGEAHLVFALSWTPLRV